MHIKDKLALKNVCFIRVFQKCLFSRRKKCYLHQRLPCFKIFFSFQVEGCVSSLVNMMVSPHAIMQNESILTLTLLAIDCQQSESDHDILITQLVRSEIGKHIAVLIETNCAKTFINCVENLIAFLDVTSKNNSILLDYKEANVHESLQKLMSKAELSEKLVVCCKNIISIISQVQAEK